MDKTLYSKPFHESLTFTPVYGDGDSVPIDQQPVQKFNIDPATGMPMSDITAVLRSQGLDRERLLANLEQFREEFLPEDLSNEQALKFMNPRLCQLPSELAEYAEFVAQKQLEEKRISDEAKAFEEEAKQFEEFKKSLSEQKDDNDNDVNN